METTTRIMLQPFVAVRTELKVLTNALRAVHLGLIFKQSFTPYQMRVSWKRGFIVLHKPLDASAQKALTEIQSAYFAKLYAKLFEHTTETKRTTKVEPCGEHTDCLQGKRGKEMVHFPVSEARSRSRIVSKGGREISFEEYREAIELAKNTKRSVMDCIREIAGESEYKVTYLRIEETGKQVHYGIVKASLTKFFSTVYDNVGQRKGVNSRLWYNAIQTKDILQDVAYHMGLLIHNNSPLLNNEAELSRYLIQVGKNMFWDSLELPVIKVGEDKAERGIHELTVSDGKSRRGKVQVKTGIKEKRYTYKRSGVPRLYNIGVGDDIVPSDTIGLGKVVRQYEEAVA